MRRPTGHKVVVYWRHPSRTRTLGVGGPYSDGSYSLKKKKRPRVRKSLIQIGSRVLRISTYQLNRLVEVVVTNEHSIIGHRLEVLLSM